MSYHSELSGTNVIRRFTKRALITICLAGAVLSGQTGHSQTLNPVFDLPAHSRGVAWAWDKLWIGGIAERGNWIWAVDPETGTIVDSLPAPVPDCLSLEGHSDGLVYLSQRSDSTYLVTERGVRSFNNPFRHFAGLGSDGENLWGATYFDPQGTLFKMDMSGRILHSVPYNGKQSRDMAFLKGRLYIADHFTQNIRVIDPSTGRLIRNITTPGINPSGVASDGEGLWVIDEGDGKPEDRMYYVYIRPEGGIRFSALQHNYGSVIENQSVDWHLWIYNDGPRTTQLVSFEAVEGNDQVFIPHVWNFPQSIESGDSISLGISFWPAYPDSVHLVLSIVYDLDRVENRIDLRGKGVRQQRNIVIPERNLSFGLCYYGIGSRNSNLRQLTIENAGGDPLTIREIRFSDNSFLTGGIEFPHTFSTPGAYKIPIFFRPTNRGQIRATGTIVSDDPDSPEINFSLSGQAQLYSYPGGTPLWNITVGDAQIALPRVRAIQPIDDVSGDGLADVIVASNDYTIACYHAASTLLATPYWSYNTDVNPWRSGIVSGPKAISEGSDWNRDGRKDIVFGLDGGAMSIVALDGNTGEVIWTVDTHGLPGYGGIPTIVQATNDWTGDNYNDVIVATVANDENHTTQSIFLINGRTARVVWFTELDANPFSIADVGDITGDEVSDFAVVLSNGAILGIDGLEGHELYTESIEGSIRALDTCPDVNGDGSIDFCVATYNDGFYIVNGSNGSVIRHVNGPEGVTLLTAMNDLNQNGSADFVYGTINSFFMAIDGESGQNIWLENIQVGARPLSLDRIGDLNGDGLDDFLIGSLDGRLYATSGNGRTTLWSYSNVDEGNGFCLVVASRDIDGNGQNDVVAAMESGTVYAFAGTYIGNNAVEPQEDGLPFAVSLSPGYPNPFNSSVFIPFRLNNPAEVALRIFDVNGREIYAGKRMLLNTGEHRLQWNGSDMSGSPAGSGVYFTRIETDAGSVVQSIQLLR